MNMNVNSLAVSQRHNQAHDDQLNLIKKKGRNCRRYSEVKYIIF